MASLRKVRVGSVNRHPIMHGHIASLHERSHFALISSDCSAALKNIGPLSKTWNQPCIHW
jgi:hypothetical protein